MNDECNAPFSGLLNNLPADPVGGRVTISPPAKSEFTESGHVMASGVDGLVLAVDLIWRDDSFFRALNSLKAEAMVQEVPMPTLMKSPDGVHALMFDVEPFGKEGYSWILRSPEYHIKLGNWMRPKSRPSAMIEVRAEALWLYGVTEAVDRLILLLQGVGAFVDVAKASRVDLCVDLFITDAMWRFGLFDHLVTWAVDNAIHFKHRKLTGVQIGKGAILARVYDKPREIVSRSQKSWMYDIWNIHYVPDGFKIVRFEFQLRREVLKDLAVNTVWDFLSHPRGLWAYCVHKWLKFVDDPSADTPYQNPLPFWNVVQEGFLGGQLGAPMIRAKVVNVKKKQLSQQMLGQFTSLLAIDNEHLIPDLCLEKKLDVVKESAELIGMTDSVLSERVRRKHAKYMKAKQKFKDAEEWRKQNGLPIWGKDGGRRKYGGG